MKANILIIDDDKNYVEILSDDLKNRGRNLTIFSTDDKDEMLSILVENKIDLVVLDLLLKEWTGINYFKELEENGILLPPTIVISGVQYPRIVSKLMKLGAVEYIDKPVSNQEIINRIIFYLSENFKKKGSRAEKNKNYEVKKMDDFMNPVEMTDNEIMKKIIAKARKYSSTNTIILIIGESGTGKELLAKYIHDLSKSNAQVMICVNCGAIRKELFESEMFGHKKGAFTGAYTDKKGYFEAAKGSTLFLDEVGELHPENQVKLLRVLQDMKFHKVGDTEEISTDCRIICASNKDLKVEVNKGNYREDLFYRINECLLHLPPLRERREDIISLIYYFIREFNKEFEKNIELFDVNVLNVLMYREWKGNIRELKNVIRNMVIEQEGQVLNFESLPAEILFPNNGTEMISGNNLTFKDASSILQKNMLIRALEFNNWDSLKAGKMLGITPVHIRRLMKKYRILKRKK